MANHGANDIFGPPRFSRADRSPKKEISFRHHTAGLRAEGSFLKLLFRKMSHEKPNSSAKVPVRNLKSELPFKLGKATSHDSTRGILKVGELLKIFFDSATQWTWPLLSARRSDSSNLQNFPGKYLVPKINVRVDP